MGGQEIRREIGVIECDMIPNDQKQIVPAHKEETQRTIKRSQLQ